MNQETAVQLSDEYLRGAWVFDHPFLGKVFLQFNEVGEVDFFYNFEGEVKESREYMLFTDTEGNIRLNIYSAGDAEDGSIIYWENGLKPYYSMAPNIIPAPNGIDSSVVEEPIINITNLNQDEFIVFSEEDKSQIIFKRLKDEAGQRIFHYSFFDREAQADNRYGDPESSSGDPSSSSNSEGINAYQCYNCLYLSMGNDEPLTYAFDGCTRNSNGTRDGHYWKPVNTNYGKQCRNCGVTCHILGASIYVKCPKSDWGGNHDWGKEW